MIQSGLFFEVGVDIVDAKVHLEFELQFFGCLLCGIPQFLGQSEKLVPISLVIGIHY